MLNRRSPQKTGQRDDLDHFFHDPDYITFSDIITFIRRYFFTLVAGVVIGGGLAFFYVWTATPLYTARAQLLIDPTYTQVLQDKRSEVTLDAAHIQNQIEVIKSDKILRVVVEQLGLLDDPEFQPEPQGDGAPERRLSDYQKRRTGLAKLQSKLDVRRSGVSHVIDISVETKDREKSARIANAIANAYRKEQVQARAEAARQSSEWLESRISRLRTKLDEAASALQSFRAGRDVQPSSDDAKADGPQTIAALEATVDAYRKIYEGYYQAFTDKVEQQTYPVSNARLITPATPPLGKSHPRSKLMLAFGLFAGSLAGLGIAFLRNAMDKSTRSPKQIRERIGLECIARIPHFRLPRTRLQKLHLKSSKVLSLQQRRQTFRHAVDNPFSQFAGSIKALRTAVSKAGGRDGIHTLGVTSALPEEGKSTLVANLAAAFALASHKTLVIDADLHNSMISETLAPAANVGLLEVLGDGVDPANCIWRGSGDVPDVLPVVLSDKTHVSYDLVGSERMTHLLQDLREDYDIILIDMPPLTPVAEGISLSGRLDGVLLAVAWASTPLDVLTEITYGLHLADANMLGVVLTKVDESAVHLRLQKTWKYQ